MCLDLKSYFNRGSSATNPSTRESGNVEVEVGESVGAGQVEERQEQLQLGSVQVEEVIEEETVQGDLITEFNPDYIVSDPGLRIPIDRFAPNIRDEVRRAFIAKGPTQPTGHNFPPQRIKGPFKKIGLSNIIGWSIVWRRIGPFASIVIFLDMIEWMINLVMMSLQKLGFKNGRMHTCHFECMLVGLIAYIIKLEQLLMILITKGQV